MPCYQVECSIQGSKIVSNAIEANSVSEAREEAKEDLLRHVECDLEMVVRPVGEDGEIGAPIVQRYRVTASQSGGGPDVSETFDATSEIAAEQEMLDLIWRDLPLGWDRDHCFSMKVEVVDDAKVD